MHTTSYAQFVDEVRMSILDVHIKFASNTIYVITVRSEYDVFQFSESSSQG